MVKIGKKYFYGQNNPSLLDEFGKLIRKKRLRSLDSVERSGSSGRSGSSEGSGRSRDERSLVRAPSCSVQYSLSR